MPIDWNLYLARYQQARGGYYFGAAEDACDSRLLLTEGEKTPLLVSFGMVPSGRYYVNTLKAQTMVQLDGDYELNIRARSLVGDGVTSVMGIAGKGMDFGYPEATRGRFITTNNEGFTKLVLGDLSLRNALAARQKEYLKIQASPQGDGWHVAEVGARGFEGSVVGRSPWISESMGQDTAYMDEADREVLLRAGSEHFNAQMDAFLDFLRAARGAVMAWRM